MRQETLETNIDLLGQKNLAIEVNYQFTNVVDLTIVEYFLFNKDGERYNATEFFEMDLTELTLIVVKLYSECINQVERNLDAGKYE